MNNFHVSIWCRSAFGSTQCSIQQVPGEISLEIKLSIHLLLVPRSGKRGSKYPLPHMLYDVMPKQLSTETSLVLSITMQNCGQETYDSNQEVLLISNNYMKKYSELSGLKRMVICVSYYFHRRCSSEI